MANTTDNGLALFSSLDLTADEPKDKLSQSEIYLKDVRLSKNKYGDSTEYTTTVKENGLGNVTDEHNVDVAGSTYVDQFNKDGSDIMFVNTSQVGNQTVAQTQDYTNYDKYFHRSGNK